MKQKLIHLLSGLTAVICLAACSSPSAAPAASAGAGSSGEAAVTQPADQEAETPVEQPAADPAAAENPASDPAGAAEAGSEAAPLGGGVITFGAEGPTVEGSGAEIVADGIRITAGGSYTLRGGDSSAAVSVYAPGQHVQLILDGVRLYSGEGPALSFDLVQDAEVVLTGSESIIRSGARRNPADPQQSVQGNGARDGALHSEAPLVISGDGSMLVAGAAQSAIVVRNSLTLAGGSLLVQSENNGIAISNGSIDITGGRLFINAQIDGISCQRDIRISGGSVFAFSGLQNDGNGLHPGGSLEISGGSVTAAGAYSRRPTGPQPAVIFEFSRQAAGCVFSIAGAEGEAAAFEVPGACRTILYSSPNLAADAEYSVSVDGAVIATAVSFTG